MNIRVLLCSDDNRYIMRLAETMERTPPDTGDVFELSLFTDSKKLEATLSEPIKGKTRFDIALVDESMVDFVSPHAPVVLLFTNDGTHDGAKYNGNPSITFLDKYQRVSDITKKILLALAATRPDFGIGTGAVCAFFGPSGGSGTSTIAASFAVAAALLGIKPLFVSLEQFNSTELLFTGPQTPDKGLYDVFYAIAGGTGAIATIDAVREKDSSGVAYLNKFPMWAEVVQRTPDEIKTFIDAARGSHDIDIVVLDLGSGFAAFTETVFECANEIFVVSGTDTVSNLKLKTFLDDASNFVQDYISKTNLIYNKVSGKPTESYECKTVTYVPSIHGLAAEEYLRGLVNPLWNKQN